MATVDLRPSKATEGGFWDGINLTITEASAVIFKYKDKSGTSRGEAPGVSFTFEDETGESREQFYSAGSLDAFRPNKKKTALEAVGTRSQLNKQCTLYKFLESLVEGGLPENRLDSDDITSVVGTTFLCVNAPAPTDNNKDRTLLLCDSVVSLPGEDATDTSSDAGADDAMTDAASDVVMEILAEEDDGLPKRKLLSKATKLLKDNSDRKKIAKLLTDDAFLNSGDWDYTDGVLKI